MLATHVWRTHQVWAEEYRAYFGLSAKRGLVGTDTSAKLRAAATEYLVPHHDAAVKLAREATRGKPLRERGPRIRLETRLDPAYQATLRNRGLRSAEIMQERLKDPDQRDRLREQLRFRGPISVVCTECGTTFMSRLQGASSRKVVVCGEGCRRRRKQAARARGRLSETERGGRIATSARRRGSRAQLYDMARARLSNSDLATGGALSLADRHLLERYLGLVGWPATSLRRLASETGMTRHALERRFAESLGLLLGQGKLGRLCGVCGQLFVPPYLSSRRTTCSVQCERQHHRLSGTADRLRQPARRQGRELAPQLAALDQADFERLSATEAALVRSYYGLDGGRLFTKEELARQFGLSIWKVDSGLKRAVAVLVAPDSSGALGREARRQQRRDRIAQRRRERGRPLASAIHDLGTDAFEKLGALERELAQRYYGIGGERRWTRRELAREFGMSTGRVEDLVNAAVRTLTGMDVAPRFDRTCAVCGGSFTVRSRVSRRRTCGAGCEGELKRAAGRASGRARRGGPLVS
jgi:AraC-like DNA-binding protein